MEIFANKHECTGCGACYNACGQKAISMEADQEGFFYPVIDSRLCTECGSCRQVCPTAKPTRLVTPVRLPSVYAAWNLDPNIRFNSTSGGIFAALACGILKAGGYVAGARYAADFSVEHHIIHTIEDLELLMQSKYSQSKIGEVFTVIKGLLDKKHTVLFCGTPCQNAGLRSFLRKDYENLYCCDFICRGANSPKVFQMYLSSLRREYSAEIERVWFKNKIGGWNRCNTRVIFQDGRQYVKDRENDLFARGYLKYNLFCRPSCYKCHFKGLARPVDITLADFWGIGDKSPELDDNRGTSMVLLHSAKGESLFASIRDTIFCEKRETADALYSSVMLTRSIKPGANRRPFFENIDRFTLEQLMDRYGGFTLPEKLMMTTRTIYQTLKSLARKAG